MRVLMGIVKNEHGTYHVRRKVPDKLQAAVALILGSDKPKVSWLKKSLGTKDASKANVRAKPVMMDFDKIIAKAEASLKQRPVQSSLSDAEIKRISAYHFAFMLNEDEEHRAGDFEDSAEFGLSERRFRKHSESIDVALAGSEAALARGDISVLGDIIDELLATHGINLDRQSEAFRKLGGAVLREHVMALRDTEARNQGTSITSPRLDAPTKKAEPAEGHTIRAALKGWAKATRPAPSTLREFGHAVDRFVELHGDMQLVEIKRRHVLAFREALQDIPPRRSGIIRNADLPTLVDWRLSNPNADRISPGTVNKLLGGIQAISLWGKDNGFIDEDTPWPDPFAKMRLSEDEPEREPWETGDLVKLFASPVFADGARPKAAGGEAAYWLPLLGMFTGARLGELAPLRVTDVQEDTGSQVPFLAIRVIVEEGKRLKTTSSIRAVPVHPELIRLGFLEYVEEARKQNSKALLFPALKPGPHGGLGESWSKWFGRYIRVNGITNKKAVFHSFRHGFKDALRRAKLGEDINDALTGHSGGGTGRKYGAKDMISRYGADALQEVT